MPRTPTTQQMSASYVIAGDPLIIMWSSNRNDMRSRHWVPNHFMPAVAKVPTQCQYASEQASSATSDWTEHEVPPPEDCLGKWVIVEYDRNPYPGIVEDVDEGDLLINCMHAVGKNLTNCFFWPKLFKDICWYEHKNVLHLIPEPVLKTGNFQHYSVDPAIWEVVSSVKQNN